jgi:hypothetical protein
MNRIVPFLRELERQGDEGKLINAVDLSNRVAKEFQIIRRFLEQHIATSSSALAART